MPSASDIFSSLDEALNAGRVEDAAIWKETLRQDAKDPIALTLLGRIAAAEGDLIGGLAHLGEAIRIEPYYEPAYGFRAQVFSQLGLHLRAVQDMESLLLYYPIKTDLVANYADQAMRVGRLDHAAQMLSLAVRRNPTNAFFSNLSGLIRQNASRLDEACMYYHRALELDPGNPHYANNLGTAYHKLDDYEQAQTYLELSINLQPNFEMAWYNLGNVFKDCRRFIEAEQCYRRAIELRPDYPDARLNLGCILIQQNRWDEGWRQYEYRWRVPNLMAQPSGTLPRWLGESLSGKHLVVSAEQGIGDTLQFLRYLPQAAALGVRITFVCPPEIAALASRFHPDIKVTSNGNVATYGGYWAPLMSLPPLLHATPEHIPPAPYLEVEEDRVLYYLHKLGKRRGRLRIGLIWGGNPRQQADHQRTAPLDQLQELISLPNIRWISLQKGAHQQELADAHLPIEDWSADLDDYDESAALMQALDGVVSVCSSPLHLAGALGIRAIGMLSWAADWRWGLEGSTTPWYPSVTLIRQPQLGDWKSVAAAVAQEIAEWKPLPQPRAENPQLRRRPAPTFRTKTHYGIMDVLRNDTYITSSLSSFGEYCQDEINLLARYLKPGDTVIEAGANMGAHTLPTARLVGIEGRVIAFEPQYEAFRLLERNVRRAQLEQVELHRAALGAKLGTTKVPSFDGRVVQNYGATKIHSDRPDGDEVPLVTIDSLELHRCDLIKLDVEGSEPEAIAGALETINRFRPLLYLEDQFDYPSEKLRRDLREMGYRVYRHRALITPLHASQSRTEWSASALAIPQERVQPTEFNEYSEELA